MEEVKTTLIFAAVFARTFVQDLEAPALDLGVTRIHAEQIAGEDRRLVAAGARADFQEYVRIVVRILGHQQCLDFEFDGGDARAKSLAIVDCELPEFCVVVVEQRIRFVDLATQRFD